MNLTIVSLSTSERSVGRTCAKFLESYWGTTGHSVTYIDIRGLTPIWVNDQKLPDLPSEYMEVEAVLRKSDGVALFWPVYCYSPASAAKAFTEVFGGAFEKMPVAMVAAAGSIRSHLAVGQLMQSMMFEQETLCYPKAVLATRSELVDDQPNPELQGRLRDLADGFAQYAHSLRSFRSAAPVAFSTTSPPTECSVVRDQHNNDSSMRLKPIGPSRVAFTVKSYDRCRAFYEGYLGLNVDREWTRPGERGVVYDLGPTHLELLEGPHDPVGECAYLYIPVADVDAVWEALSINATVAVPITSHDWGHRNFVVLDPAGIRLKFFSRVPEDSRVI